MGLNPSLPWANPECRDSPPVQSGGKKPPSSGPAEPDTISLSAQANLSVPVCSSHHGSLLVLVAHSCTLADPEAPAGLELTLRLWKSAPLGLQSSMLCGWSHGLSDAGAVAPRARPGSQQQPEGLSGTSSRK